MAILIVFIWQEDGSSIMRLHLDWMTQFQYSIIIIWRIVENLEIWMEVGLFYFML